MVKGKKPIFGKKDFELIILWMVNNNEQCTWANLKELVKPSTLSIYLKNLQKKNLIVKKEFNQYSITSKGKDRFYELSQSKKTKRKLNFPPDVLLWKRNYDHWILWMLYNNSFCKWADFLKMNIRDLSNLTISCEHKADKNHMAVSAASILAKSAREKEVSKIKEEHGDIGSGYPSDPKTKQFLSKNRNNKKTKSIFRKSWSTWKNAASDQKKLEF